MPEYHTLYGQKAAAALLDRSKPDPENRRIIHFSGQALGAVLAFRQAASMSRDPDERAKLICHAEDFSRIYAAINDELELLAAAAAAIRAERE